MKRGNLPLGFTIIETMIFLAVSGALLIASLTLVGGTQNKAQFNNSVRDFEQQITKVINNVSNGYYPKLNGESCSRSGSGEIQFGGSQSNLGVNSGCTYLGRVVEFSTDGSMKIISVAGVRTTLNGSEPTTMAEARPRAITSNIEDIPLKNGIKVDSVKIGGAGNYGAVGFFTSLGSKKTDNSLQSGSLSINFIALNVPINAPSSIDTPALMTNTGFRNSYYNTNINPQDGVAICINSGTNNEHAIVTIGGNRNTSSISTVISGGKCT